MNTKVTKLPTNEMLKFKPHSKDEQTAKYLARLCAMHCNIYAFVYIVAEQRERVLFCIM